MAGKLRHRAMTDPVIPTIADANELIDTINEIHAMLMFLVGEPFLFKCAQCGHSYENLGDRLRCSDSH
jgi:hypothetical protein